MSTIPNVFRLAALASILLGGCVENEAETRKFPTNAGTGEAEKPASADPVPRETDPEYAEEKRITINDEVSYVLANGEKLNAQFPDTFWIPPREARSGLQAEQLVKLVFRITVNEEIQTERMWVIVGDHTETGYTGTLDNTPQCTNEIKAGQPVQFAARHVIDIFEETE